PRGILGGGPEVSQQRSFAGPGARREEPTQTRRGAMAALSPRTAGPVAQALLASAGHGPAGTAGILGQVPHHRDSRCGSTARGAGAHPPGIRAHGIDTGGASQDDVFLGSGRAREVEARVHQAASERVAEAAPGGSTQTAAQGQKALKKTTDDTDKTVAIRLLSVSHIRVIRGSPVRTYP